MSLYGRVVWFYFSTYLAYPVELLSSVLRPLIEFGFVILFWSIVANSTKQPLQMNHLLSYFLLATGVADLLLLDGLKFGSFLGKEIKRGKLSQALIKPVNPLWYELAQRLGARGVSSATAVVFIVAGLIVQPPANWLGILLFFIYMPMAISISLGINTLVGSVAFYFTESSGFSNMVGHVVRVFSGALVPLYLFPSTIKTIAISLPFATAIYGPVHALQITTMTNEVWLGLAIGLVWSLTLIWLSLYVWRKGLKSYEAVGI